MADANLMARLARPGGGFAMVALDQRESLRGYLSQAFGSPASDAQLVQFKAEAIKDLGDVASGLLLDLDYGVPALADGPPLAGRLMLAADRLEQEPGGPITGIELDERVTGARIAGNGCSGLKLLLIWRPGEDARLARRRLAERFLESCRQLSVLALLEGVLPEQLRSQARQGDGAAWFEMHRELLEFPADIYKTELPAPPEADEEVIVARCRQLTEMAPRPWVLLSSGIPPDLFPGAVRAACRGGASGFVAGRAIWRPAISATGYQRLAKDGARERLERLAEIVDRHARPWGSAVGAS